MISMRYFLAIYFIFLGKFLLRYVNSIVTNDLFVLCLGYQGLSYALTCYRCTGCGTTSNTWSTTVSTTVNDSCFVSNVVY